MIITVAPYVYIYLLLNWIDLIPSDVSDYFHSGPKDQRFPLSRGFLPDSEPRPFLSWDWSWIDGNRREFRKRNRSVCPLTLASSTATITCLVFNEPARHFVRHHLAQRLQHRFFTLQHVMYIRVWYFYLIFPWARAIFFKCKPPNQNQLFLGQTFFSWLSYV